MPQSERVTNSGLRGTPRKLATVLAFKHDTGLEALEIGHLAWLCSLSERTVRKHLDALASTGCVERNGEMVRLVPDALPARA